jgi:two-component system sensor histidine kinase HydH
MSQGRLALFRSSPPVRLVLAQESLFVRHETTIRPVAAVAAAIAFISVLHQTTPVSMAHWHNALQHLYYLPIVFAGLSFGWLGGLSAALLVALSNAPHNWSTWTTSPNYAIDQLWEIPLFCAAGVLTGVLAERGRRQRAELERTTSRLTEVYKKLQDNFDNMKRAERLFAMGQLSAGLAHEVRSPLASIAGAAGILQRNLRLEKREGECLDIIAKECRRLNNLLTHFLDFARPRAPKYQAMDATCLFESVIELAAHVVGRQAITLRKEVDAALKPFECDPELLTQVLLNLLINAIQAMPEGGTVLLSGRPRNGRILIQVKDEGCGIGAADRDRIFDPFFTTKQTGTGLGLSVAHQIVEQHGGILSAEPNLDKGTTFSVVLPVHHERQNET